MEQGYEEAKTQESSRGGAWQVGWTGAQRGQAAGQPRKWPQRRPSQEPQEKDRGPAQRAASSARSLQELVQIVIAAIRARFGQSYIGLRHHCIRSAGARCLKQQTSFHGS